MKPLNKVAIQWSSNLAYAIGLITSDGNLSPDGRHINMTSKDEEIVVMFKKCLQLDNKIGRKARGYSNEKKYYVVQFGDVRFYRFLLSIGLTPAKSKTIGKLLIPREYFADFFRGCIDGDGSITTNTHPESKHLQLKIRLVSASTDFLYWVKKEIIKYANLDGGWITKNASVHTLHFGKSDSKKLIRYMYYDKNAYFLKRKYAVAKEFI